MGSGVDVAIAVERLHDFDAHAGLTFISVDTKVPIKAGRAAPLMPVGFLATSGEIGGSLHIDPGVVFTTPINTTVDLNPSARLIVPFCDGCSPSLGFELSVGIRRSANRVNVRPTFGAVVNPRPGSIIWTVGSAVT